MRLTTGKHHRPTVSYFTLNFLASPSNTSRSPVINRISNTDRVPSSLDCGMPSTRAFPLSTVLHTVGKSSPFRIISVHRRARSCARSPAMNKFNAAVRRPAFDLDQSIAQIPIWGQTQPVKYRGIRYTIRVGIEPKQWSVAIHPAGVEMAGKIVTGTRGY